MTTEGDEPEVPPTWFVKLNRWTPWILVGIAVASVALQVSVAYADEPARWPDAPVVFYYNGPAELEAGVVAGLLTWNERAAVHVEYGGAPPRSRERLNVVSFEPNDIGALAAARKHVVDGVIVEADIYLRPNATFGVGAGDWFSIEYVVAHEVGHALGLHHSDEPCDTREDRPIMCAGAVWGVEVPLHPDDVETLRALYPPSAER